MKTGWHLPWSSETAGVSQDVPLSYSWLQESFGESDKLSDSLQEDGSFSSSSSVLSSSFSSNLSLLTSCLSASESCSSSSSGCLFLMPLFGVISPSDGEESLQKWQYGISPSNYILEINAMSSSYVFLLKMRSWECLLMEEMSGLDMYYHCTGIFNKKYWVDSLCILHTYSQCHTWTTVDSITWYGAPPPPLWLALALYWQDSQGARWSKANDNLTALVCWAVLVCLVHLHFDCRKRKQPFLTRVISQDGKSAELLRPKLTGKA